MLICGMLLLRAIVDKPKPQLAGLSQGRIKLGFANAAKLPGCVDGFRLLIVVVVTAIENPGPPIDSALNKAWIDRMLEFL